MTQSDEPPRAAVDAMRDLLLCCGLRWDEEALRKTGVGALALLRALPDADVWPLVAYLAQGREPTEAMVEAGAKQLALGKPLNGAHMWDAMQCGRAMLAAAAQGGDDAKG